MIATEQAFLVPQNLDEAETLVNKLTIEDLRAFCFTFGLSQDGTKASLKERLMEYYEEKFKSSLGSPVPMPRRRHSAESLKTTEKETLFSSALVDVEQRIDNLEFVVSQMREYMDESLKQFRVSLTESIKESTERMMRAFDKPSDGDPRINSGPNRFVPDIKSVAANRKLNFLEKNAIGVCVELEKLLHAEAAPTRIESQLKRLSKYETNRKLNFLEKNAIGVCVELEKLLHAEAAPTRIESQLKRLSKYETDCLHSVEEIFSISRNSFDSWKVTCSVKRLTMI